MELAALRSRWMGVWRRWRSECVVGGRERHAQTVPVDWLWPANGKRGEERAARDCSQRASRFALPHWLPPRTEGGAGTSDQPLSSAGAPI